MMTFEEPIFRKSTVLGFATFFLVAGWGVSWACLKGCEAAFDAVMYNPPEVAADVRSPDGKWRIRATRDPGMDGDARYDVWIAGGDGADERRLGDVGDLKRHAVEVVWSTDSTLASVWLDGDLVMVHDVQKRMLIPKGLVARPFSRRELTQAEVDAMVARKYPMELPAGLLESVAATRPIAKPRGLESNRRP